MSSKRKNHSKPDSEVLTNETIFGPPPILPQEDASAYEALLRRVSKDVKPSDIFEKFWVRDIVDHTWGILRLRRIKMSLVSRSIPKALASCLVPIVIETPQYEEAVKTKPTITTGAWSMSIAERWAVKDPYTVAWINDLLANDRISMDAVVSSAFANELHWIEKVDRLVASAESRRNAVLREIVRHRATFARSLRGEIQKVEDAEFQVVASKTRPRTIEANNEAHDEHATT